MFNYHQFHTNNHFNSPIGTGVELSIFPYSGYNRNSPYAQPIRIERARFSKNSILDYDDVHNNEINNTYDDPYTTLDASNLYGGPIPQIYKVTIEGVSTNLPCNVSECNYLNNSFYLYKNYSSDYRYHSWSNTFPSEAQPSGIYFDTPESQFDNDYILDGIYNKITLFSHENVDKVTDIFMVLEKKSYGGNMVFGQYDFYDDTPLLLHKKFEENEKIYALQEKIELSNVDYISISGVANPYSPSIICVNSGHRVNTCDFTQATAFLEPYNTGMYDIHSNSNLFTNRIWNGYGNVIIEMTPTSSGYMSYVDKVSPYPQHHSDVYEVPSVYRLRFRDIIARDESQLQVPCSSFFSHDFYLISVGENSIPGNSYPASPTVINYSWRNEYIQYFNNQYDIGQHHLSNAGIQENNPNVYDVRLNVGSGDMSLKIVERTGNFIHFTHAKTDNVFKTTFTNWNYDGVYDFATNTIVADTDTAVSKRCDFNNAYLELTSIDTLFNNGVRHRNCSPLCTDNRHPISGSVNFTMSSYDIHGNPYPASSPQSYTISNHKVPILLEEDYNSNSYDSLYYRCQRKNITGFYGRLDFPPVDFTFEDCTGIFGSPPTTIPISGFSIPVPAYPVPLNLNVLGAYATGCASKMDCSQVFELGTYQQLCATNNYYVSLSGQLTLTDFI